MLEAEHHIYLIDTGISEGWNFVFYKMPEIFDWLSN